MSCCAALCSAPNSSTGTNLPVQSSTMSREVPRGSPSTSGLPKRFTAASASRKGSVLMKRSASLTQAPWSGRPVESSSWSELSERNK